MVIYYMCVVSYACSSTGNALNFLVAQVKIQGAHSIRIHIDSTGCENRGGYDIPSA